MAVHAFLFPWTNRILEFYLDDTLPAGDENAPSQAGAVAGALTERPAGRSRSATEGQARTGAAANGAEIRT
jgi:hypothetical protein